MAPEIQTDSLPELSSEDVERGEWIDTRAADKARRAAKARQASGRRRFIDPTTCERDYDVAEIEFMQAMQSYKKDSGRMFPTWSEVLEVLKGLGYHKDDDPDSACTPSVANQVPGDRTRGAGPG